MSLETTLALVKYETYRTITAGLDSSRHLPAPSSLLAAKLVVYPIKDDTLAIFSIAPSVPSVGPTTMVTFTATGSHMSPSKYAQSFTEYPSLRTLAVVQLALPMRQINTEKQMKRLTESSFVSVSPELMERSKLPSSGSRSQPLAAPSSFGFRILSSKTI